MQAHSILLAARATYGQRAARPLLCQAAIDCHRCAAHPPGSHGAVAGPQGLCELPVAFLPTYMRQTSLKQPGGPPPPRYGLKRFPAWTDRVLMDADGLAATAAAGAPAAVYTAVVQPDDGVVPCDHEMVYLAFTLA